MQLQTRDIRQSPAIIGDCLHAVIKITEISKELYPNVKHIIKSMKNKGHACTL